MFMDRLQKNAPGRIVWRLSKGWECYKLNNGLYIVVPEGECPPELGEKVKALPSKVHLERVGESSYYEAFKLTRLK